jgi:hypothetical protein
MSATASLPMYARLGERELPVRWAWYRPEPQVGDTVRLPTAPNGNDGWQSFRIVGKHLSEVVPTIEPAFTMIHLDVEPIALQD